MSSGDRNDKMKSISLSGSRLMSCSSRSLQNTHKNKFLIYYLMMKLARLCMVISVIRVMVTGGENNNVSNKQTTHQMCTV